MEYQAVPTESLRNFPSLKLKPSATRSQAHVLLEGVHGTFIKNYDFAGWPTDGQDPKGSSVVHSFWGFFEHGLAVEMVTAAKSTRRETGCCGCGDRIVTQKATAVHSWHFVQRNGIRDIQTRCFTEATKEGAISSAVIVISLLDDLSAQNDDFPQKFHVMLESAGAAEFFTFCHNYLQSRNWCPKPTIDRYFVLAAQSGATIPAPVQTAENKDGGSLTTKSSRIN